MSNSRDALHLVDAGFRGLRWLQLARLLRLPRIILEGICRQCAIRPALTQAGMIDQLDNWVSTSSRYFGVLLGLDVSVSAHCKAGNMMTTAKLP